jgi:hypothetical protein
MPYLLDLTKLLVISTTLVIMSFVNFKDKSAFLVTSQTSEGTSYSPFSGDVVYGLLGPMNLLQYLPHLTRAVDVRCMTGAHGLLGRH